MKNVKKNVFWGFLFCGFNKIEKKIAKFLYCAPVGSH
jgi:hypothetical protein